MLFDGDWQLAVHPNPFNARTEIAFNLPRTERGSVRIYNLAGREVAVLADGILDAGPQRLIFDGSALSSGVFFCHAETNSRTLTKKIVLLK